jgi:hypothetical protein
MQYRLGSATVPTIDKVREGLVREIKRALSENKNISDEKMLPIEKEIEKYVKELASSVARHDELGEYWKQATKEVDGLPGYYPVTESKNLPLGSPNFGTFLQRGLFGLRILLAGISETTSGPDIAIAENEPGKPLIVDGRGIELKSSSASLEASKRNLGVTVGDITIVEKATKDLESILETKAAENIAALSRFITKIYYLLWMRFESPGNTQHGSLRLRVMILFMRLKILELIKTLTSKHAANEPQVSIHKSEIETKEGLEKTSSGGVTGGDILLNKRKFTVKILFGKVDTTDIKQIMRHEIKVLSSFYAQRHDFINEIENSPKTAQKFYAFIMGKFIKTMKFKNLGEM